MKLGLVKLVVAALLVLMVVTALFTDLFGRQLIPGLPKLQLQRIERTQTSVVTIADVRDIAELATLQLVHRAVFPYDYLPEGVSLPSVLRELRTSNLSIQETLTDDEYRYFRTYSLAQEVNLGVTGGTFDFVVVTIVITAGIDFSDGAVSIEVTPSDAPVRRAVVTLPGPSVIDVRLEDIDPATYPYPTASLSADGWRKVADYVIEETISPERETALLEDAEQRAHRLVGRLLEQAGFDSVDFR